MRIDLFYFLAFVSLPILSELSIEVDISEQRLYILNDQMITKSYPISSSYFGEGQVENSYKTPLGKHIIQEMIGTNVEKNTIFVNRIQNNQIASIIHEKLDTENDYITSRIMWLSGVEDGFNNGTSVDSYDRYIYIHGTQEEGLIGSKASHGCIRMFNHDVIELYNLVKKGTKVNIRL
tara:strand:- start:792 stop:1325 length:534 start_codon:yes stop_codon:yes gene_type:complete